MTRLDKIRKRQQDPDVVKYKQYEESLDATLKQVVCNAISGRK